MTTDNGFERRLRAILCDALEGDVPPHPVWIDSPAARRIAVAPGHPRRWPLRALSLAAVLVVGGAIATAALMTHPPTPRPAAASNGWVAFSTWDEGESWDITVTRPGQSPTLVAVPDGAGADHDLPGLLTGRTDPCLCGSPWRGAAVDAWR